MCIISTTGPIYIPVIGISTRESPISSAGHIPEIETVDPIIVLWSGIIGSVWRHSSGKSECRGDSICSTWSEIKIDDYISGALEIVGLSLSCLSDTRGVEFEIDSSGPQESAILDSDPSSLTDAARISIGWIMYSYHPQDIGSIDEIIRDYGLRNEIIGSISIDHRSCVDDVGLFQDIELVAVICGSAHHQVYPCRSTIQMHRNSIRRKVEAIRTRKRYYSQRQEECHQ